MKATLEFDMNDPDEREQHKTMLAAQDMAITLADIRQKMFRPARKHGFNDQYLNTINNDNPELFEHLEKIFDEICENHGVMEFT